MTKQDLEKALEHQRKLRVTLLDNLETLELQAAEYGSLDIPLRLVNEVRNHKQQLQDINSEITRLEALLTKGVDLGKVTSSTTKTGTRRSLRVFLCHSSEDKVHVRLLYQRLYKDGIEPWLDEEDLLPGQRWEREIEKAVQNSDVVLACLSQQSVTSTGYIQRELAYALDIADKQPEGTIFIVPLKLEECEVPERLRGWQWVNLFAERGYERLFKALNAQAINLGRTPLYLPQWESTNSSNSTQRNQDVQDDDFTPPVIGAPNIVRLKIETITLTPGQNSIVGLSIVNYGTTVDHFNVMIVGIPASWVQSPPLELRLLQGEQAQVALSVNAPRTPESRAGVYAVTVQARSRQNPNEVGEARQQWTVLPFSESTLDLKPKRVSGWRRGGYKVSLTNNGNTTVNYKLNGEDDEQSLDFGFTQQQVVLEPGATTLQQLVVRGSLHWFGSPQSRGFTVQSRTDSRGDVQLVGGQFTQRPIIPLWLLPLLLLAVMGLFFLIRLPPKIDSFGAQPAPHLYDEPVVMRWQASNAQRARLYSESQGLDVTVSPVGSYAFVASTAVPTDLVLIAASRFGVEAKATAIFRPPPSPTLTSTSTPTVTPINTSTITPILEQTASTAALFTPTVSSEDIPTLSGLTATVFNGGNVRDKPQVSGSKVIDQINGGELVQLLQKTADGRWYQVKNTRNIVGWVATTLLTIDEAVAAEVPIVQ